MKIIIFFAIAATSFIASAQGKEMTKSLNTMMGELPHHLNLLTEEDGKNFLKRGKCCYKNPYKRIVEKNKKWYWIEQIGFQVSQFEINQGAYESFKIIKDIETKVKVKGVETVKVTKKEILKKIYKLNLVNPECQNCHVNGIKLSPLDKHAWELTEVEVDGKETSSLWADERFRSNFKVTVINDCPALGQACF